MPTPIPARPLGEATPARLKVFLLAVMAATAMPEDREAIRADLRQAAIDAGLVER